MTSAPEAPNWGVIGEVDCWTQSLRVFLLRKRKKRQGNNMSKLRLDVTADVTVVPLPLHLTDEEDLEYHYQVMFMEDDDVGQTAAKVVEFSSKLEIDFCLDERDTRATKRVMETLSYELSTLINVQPGCRELSLAAATILRDARAAARDGRRGNGINGNSNGVSVHLKVSIKAEVVVAAVADDDVEPAFVAASKSSIEKLETVAVEASLVSLCSICREEMAAGSEALQMPCAHYYHENCIVASLETNRPCPQCRFPMPTSDDN